jgi:6-phosphogluconate dehydrogenase
MSMPAWPMTVKKKSFRPQHVNGAGHFVKMVHNGIEYGLMAAYAEGFNILRHANAGTRAREASAETTPFDEAEFYQYEFDLPEIAELWRRGNG